MNCRLIKNFLIALVVTLFADGCKGNDTVVWVPEQVPQNSPSAFAVSSAEITEAAPRIAETITVSILKEKRSKRSDGGSRSVTVIECGSVINDTDIVDFAPGEFISALKKDLEKTGEITVRTKDGIRYGAISGKASGDSRRPPDFLLLPRVSQMPGIRGKENLLVRSFSVALINAEGSIVGSSTTKIDLPIKKHIPETIANYYNEYEHIVKIFIQAIFTNSKVRSFLHDYQKNSRNGESRPVIKFGKLKNDTCDPYLSKNSLIWLVQDALLQSDKFRISACEGATGTPAISVFRDAEGNRIAPFASSDLVLNIRIDERKNNNAITRAYSFDLADAKNGQTVMRFTKQLGYKFAK